MSSELKLPKNTKVITKICLCNHNGITIKEFDSQEDLDKHLKSIQEYIPDES